MRVVPRRVPAATLVSAVFRLRELGIFVALAATVLFFSIHATNFATVGNWRDIATDVAMVVVVAVGETMVVLTRNIDLSIGLIVGLTAYVSSSTLAHHHGIPIVAIALLAVVIGLGAGLVNGLLVAVGHIPAIGSNPDAARFAGIRVWRRVMVAFAISGALAGLGGFMFAARFASVESNAGRGFEFDVVTAVVIGGVNVFGGSGTVLGAV